MLPVYESLETALGLERAMLRVDKFLSVRKMGFIDFKESNRLITMRFLLESHHKIYYTYEKELGVILVQGVFDARQSPTASETHSLSALLTEK